MGRGTLLLPNSVGEQAKELHAGRSKIYRVGARHLRRKLYPRDSPADDGQEFWRWCKLYGKPIGHPMLRSHDIRRGVTMEVLGRQNDLESEGGVPSGIRQVVAGSLGFVINGEAWGGVERVLSECIRVATLTGGGPDTIFRVQERNNRARG